MRSFDGEEDAQVVDGQVTGRSEPQPAFRPVGTGPIYTVQGQPMNPSQQAYQQAYGPGIDVTGLVDLGVGVATDPRSRALALFVKIPLLGYVALSSKMPALVRLGAAALAVMEALEVAQRQDELQQMLPPGWQP